MEKEKIRSQAPVAAVRFLSLPLSRLSQWVVLLCRRGLLQNIEKMETQALRIRKRENVFPVPVVVAIFRGPGSGVCVEAGEANL